jgi:hypothetical protein
MEYLMKKLLLLPLLLSNTLAQEFTTSVYEIGMHDRYVVCQTYVAPVVTIREEPSGHDKLMKAYDNIIQSSQQSIASMRAQSAEWELQRQTQELEEQTRLLRKIANE